MNGGSLERQLLPINANETANSNFYGVTSVLPKEIWGIILNHLQFYDIIFVRATNSALYKLCGEYRPFPSYFVLDQYECVEYLVENGFISCLDYVKEALHFEWSRSLTSLAAMFGQTDLLAHLVQNGQTINVDTALLECTQGTCSLEMIKYLRECGVDWDQADMDDEENWDDNYPYKNHKCALQTKTVMESMAYHGHSSCMKYAMENGCTQRVIQYTPSIECLDFAIQHGFNWKGTPKRPGQFKSTNRNICEEAARLGNIKMLKYAHQHGAPLNKSANEASQSGHLECLVYAMETSPLDLSEVSMDMKTLDCLNYIIQQYGLDAVRQNRQIWNEQLRLQNMEILRFLFDNNFPLYTDPKDILTCTFNLNYALKSVQSFKLLSAKISLEIVNPYFIFASYGCLDGLKLAFERNLPNKSRKEINEAYNRLHTRVPVPPVPGSMNQDIIQSAIVSQNIEVVRLVWEKIPRHEDFDVNQCLNCAARYSTPEILHFLSQQGAQWTSEHLAIAAKADRLWNIAYLVRIGCQWNKVDRIDRGSVSFSTR